MTGIKWQQDFKIAGLLNAKLAGARRGLTRGLMNHAARIQQRVQGGKNYDNAALPQYSPSYAEQKFADTGSTTVNYTVTGALMRSMDTEVKKQGHRLIGEIFFRAGADVNGVSNQTKAKYLQGRGVPFFGISPKQVEELKQKIVNSMDK
jgi:hypothetical protein